MIESLTAYKRAGASGILSYFSPTIAERMRPVADGTAGRPRRRGSPLPASGVDTQP